jgi:hypothetical protein
MPNKFMNMNSGCEAKLGGRFLFSSGGKYMNIYHVERDDTESTYDPTTKVLVPTKSYASDLVSTRLVYHYNNGIRNVVIHKDVWEKIRIAEDVELFDHARGVFATEAETSKSNIQIEITNTKAPTIKENKMNTNSTKEMMTQAALDGAKLVGANKANQLIVDACSKALEKAGVPKEMAEADMAQTVAKLVGPIVIHYLADTQGDTIDNLIGENASVRIKEGCKFATQAATMDVMEPLLAFLLPLLKDLASGGFNKIVNAKEEAGPALVQDEESIAV